MQVNEEFARLASDERIEKTIAALGANGIQASVVDTGAEARELLFLTLPHGAEVMNMTSRTLDSIGVSKEITDSGRYESVRNMLNTMDSQTQGRRMRELGAAPDWAVGSVHAVTEDGTVMVASATGSQLPAYAYGAGHVIWVVGAQKLVRDDQEARQRIYEYSFPLEDQRAREAYGKGSAVNKILTIHNEANPGRLTLIIVKEKLGF
jgi:hypothetical protein